MENHDSFADDVLRKIYSHPDVLVNYDLLKSIGILHSFDLLVSSFKDLEDLQEKALSIFSFDSLDDLFSYMIESILQKFIPTYLLFAIRTDRFSDQPMLRCYKNLKKSVAPLEIASLSSLQPLFDRHKGAIDYSVFLDDDQDLPAIRAMEGLNPRLIIPVQGSGELYGFVMIGKKLLEEDYSEAELFFIRTLVQYSSVAIRNIINRKWAITDGKTGLFCFSFFKERLSQELARSTRHKRQVAVILVDIDKFKTFNDSLGHQAGDDAILLVSTLLKQTMRTEDVISRFGGDEFVIFLPESDRKSAFIACERLREVVENSPLTVGHQSINITVSIGVALSSAEREMTAESLVEESDKALYQSKSNGRNCVSIYSASLLEKAAQYRS